jgi:hypothetical protein
MYRTGTSALVQALNGLGFYPGELGDQRAAGVHNEEGYWENSQILRLNDVLTSQFGMADYACQALPNNWEEFPATESLLSHTADLLKHLYSGREFAGWKDPRTTRLLPFYLRCFESHGIEGCFVGLVRNPEQVAASLHRKDFIPFDAGVGLWIHYMLSMLRFTPSRRLILVSHTLLMQQPRKALEAILKRFPIPEPTQRLWERASESIKPNLASAVSTCNLDAHPLATRVQALCCKCLEDSAEFAAGKFQDEIEEFWDEWIREVRLVAYRYRPPAELASFGDRPSKFAVQPCKWTRVRLTNCQVIDGVVRLSLNDGPGIVYLKRPSLLDSNEGAVQVQVRFGSECKAEPFGLDSSRLITYGPAVHLVLRPERPIERATFEADVFLQTGRDYAHTAYKALQDQLRPPKP